MADNIKCAKCGSDNPKSNKFCDSCGAKLAAAPSAQQSAPVVKKETVKQEKQPKIKEEKITEQIQGPVNYQPGQGIVIDWEMMAWITIMILTIISRFADLGTKPLHHDESMHAFYAWKLFKGQGYLYNPMLHGPFLFHSNALIYFLFGTTDYTARVLPAIYGTACVWIMWYFRPYMGRWGALIAAFLLAISPSFMYQSRFIRNDIYIALDTLFVVLGLFKYFENKKLSWLILASVGLALSWATKEVTYITVFIFFTFFSLRWLWEWVIEKSEPEKFEREGDVHRTLKFWFGEGWKHFVYALLVFVLIHGYLYFGKEPGNTFWQNLKYVKDGYIEAIVYWLGQHGVERGSQPWYFYILLMPFYELVPVFFGLLATFYYLLMPGKRTHYNLFLIYWWIMATIIYSWAGEKMPWLVLHPLLPLLMLSAKFLSDIFVSTGEGIKGIVKDISMAIFIVLSLGMIHGAVNVCFYGEGASPKESLIYVQTSTDATKVVRSTEKLAFRLKTLKWDSAAFRSYDMYDMEMTIEDYCSWPFAWYFREFKKIGYPPRDIPDSDIGKPLIFSGIEEANVGHDERVRKKLEKDYVYYRYKLREWWAPDEGKWWDADRATQIDMLWKRFMYRDVWNELGSYDFVVYVRKDLEKYWEQ